MQKWDKTRTAISCIGVVTARGGKKRKILKNVTINDTKPPHAAEVEKMKYQNGGAVPKRPLAADWENGKKFISCGRYKQKKYMRTDQI